MRTYWHFCHINQDGDPVMRDGSLVEIGRHYEIDREPMLCVRGYHGSFRAIDALRYAPGPWVSKRPLKGVTQGADKSVGKSFIQQPGADATEALRKFARMGALDVVHQWDAPPDVVLRYLKTGDESIRNEVTYTTMSEGWCSTHPAASNETWTAVWAATRPTVVGAARSVAQIVGVGKAEKRRLNARLTRMLNKLLKETNNE